MCINAVHQFDMVVEFGNVNVQSLYFSLYLKVNIEILLVKVSVQSLV